MNVKISVFDICVDYEINHMIDCNRHCTVNGVLLKGFVITLSLICNCPHLKDITFNTKCQLVWCD